MPDNRIIELARQQDYKAFFRSELAFRKAAVYPPFCDFYHIVCSSTQAEAAEQAMEFFQKTSAGSLKKSKIIV